MTKKPVVMFIGAHPDDIELNCGGTVLKLVESGKNVGIIDLTEGELSTRGNRRSRVLETSAASKLLGISFRENLKIRDGSIEINKINREKIIRVLRKYKPEIVFAPYPNDRHPDHIYAGNLIRESVFYSGLMKIRTGNLKAFKPGKLYFYRSAIDIPVSFIFDISSVFKKKLEVLKCYRTQFYDSESKEPETFISSSFFRNEIEARARHYGFKIGAEFGEPYYSYDAIRINDKNIFEI
ncbi:MAG: bacillithiol biosynthesis deacetylase BshB1 [Ignavibacteria bacterium]|nr:bacillithiol biosynthesis deacetylase BshB1 [Ignavibacteria bacterium]